MDEITRRLYGVDPAQFTEARTAAVAEAKARGDAKAAADLGKLRKPTMGAWAINLLAINKPALIKQLADLSRKLRDAQRELQGAELRKLAQERRTLVASLVSEAQKLAGKASLPLFEIEATLNAALADDDVAKTVQSGRLTKTVAYDGFGLAAGPDEDDSADREPRTKPKAADSARRKHEAELAEAKQSQDAAQAELRRAENAEVQATQALSEADDELHELRQRRAAIAEELNQARHALRFAQRALTAATRRVYELDPGA